MQLIHRNNILHMLVCDSLWRGNEHEVGGCGNLNRRNTERIQQAGLAIDAHLI